MTGQKKPYSSPKVTLDRDFAANVIPAIAVAAAVGAVSAALATGAPALQKKISKENRVAFIPSLLPVENIG
jgi:hypothetical protein